MQRGFPGYVWGKGGIIHDPKDTYELSQRRSGRGPSALNMGEVFPWGTQGTRDEGGYGRAKRGRMWGHDSLC